MMTTIRLYGVLGAKFGRVHRMAVSSGAEAVRALSSQLPGFTKYLTQSKDNGLAYAVFYGKRNLGEAQELHMNSAGRDIRIAPVVIGSKKGGLFQIILGVALVVVGLTTWAISAGLSTPLINLGVGLILGGVSQLLTPTPKGSSAKDKAGNEASAMFNGAINTQAQGTFVPVLYGGPLHIGSAVISAGITAEDYIVPNTGSSGRQGGGGGGGGASGLIGSGFERATEYLV